MPKIVDRDARRKEFAAAALLVLRERGYAEAKMEEIAARAGAAKGTLYQYFAGKEELVLFLFEEYFERALADAQAGPQITADDPVEDCLAFLLGFLETPKDLLPLIPVYFEIWASRSPGGELQLDRRMAAVFDELAEILAPRLARLHGGRVRAKDRATARMLVACLDGFVLHRALFRYDARTFQAQREAVEGMLRACLLNLAGRSGGKRPRKA